MKKNIKTYTTAIVFAMSFIMYSCNSSKSDGAKYYCPMKCEGEKTYDKPGSCPVCEMDLEIVKATSPKTDTAK